MPTLAAPQGPPSRLASNVSQNVHIPFKLEPDTAYQWGVRYFDSEGAGSPWSGNFTFSTATTTLTTNDWIAPADSSPTPFQARASFPNSGKRVAKAFAYAVGLGYYKLFVDGVRASNHELGAFTTYAKRVYFDTWDVTAAMDAAVGAGAPEHVIAMSVGNGWYAQPRVAVGNPVVLFELSVLYADGTRQKFGSSAKWFTSASPVTAADIYNGEVYNASLQTPGWTGPGARMSPAIWKPATKVPPPSADVKVTSHAILPPIRIGESYTPCDMWESSPGVYVFDFCQNMAGFTTLRVPEGIASESSVGIAQLHAEAIHGPKPAAVYHHYVAKEVNVYYPAGDGAAIEYTPLFVYAGFRYVQLTGYPGVPSFDTLTAHFVHTDYELIGQIAFSDPLLTAVQHITRTAAMSNFQSIPTDCPQRERRGWLGDAQLSAETNMHNFDMGAPYTSFVQQIFDAQDPAGSVQDCVPYYGHGRDPADPAWGAAYAHIADWVGEYYHDDQIFATNYKGITAHLEQLIKTAGGDNAGGLLAYGGWSDWCPPQGCHACWQNTKRSGGPENSVLVSSFYYLSELRIVARYAQILGKVADHQRYSKLATAVAAEFNAQFYDAANKTYREQGRGCSEYLSPQTMISLASHLELIPPADAAAVAETLVNDVAAQDWHLNVGIVGVKYLLPALSRAGRSDVALMIAQQRTPPSYIYMVEQGATTLWETWTGSTYQPVASWNHIMFGSNSDWYYKYVAGLRMVEGTRGWQQLEFQPHVWVPAIGQSICANLSSAQASLLTARGEVAAAWSCPSKASQGTCADADEKSAAHLTCGTGTIAKVTYVDYGAATGSCDEGFKANTTCSSTSARAVVEKLCVGQHSCTIPATNTEFHGDPCFDTKKRLVVEVACNGGSAVPVFAYSVTVPVGSSAKVHLTAMGRDTDKVDVTIAGQAVWKQGKFQAAPGISAGAAANGDVVLSVGSGSFAFAVAA